jgi:tetratricopeptide (TPR) repeat protein
LVLAWVALAGALWAPAAPAHPSLAEWIAELSAKLEAAPQDPALYRERAVAYANDGQSALALADFAAAEELGDPLAVALDRGMLLYKMKQYDAARRDLGLHLKRFPEDAAALEYRARAAREAGDGAAAVADYEALFAVETHPNPGHYLSAAQILEELEGGGPDRALTMLDRGMEKLGPVPQLQRPAIALEVQRQRYPAAIGRQRTLEAALGAGPEWKLELAELLLLAGQRAQASQALAEASAELEGLRLTPARSRARAKLELLRAELGP